LEITRLTTVPDYRVEVDAFNGPLDLLLYLVRRDEVDILDIPIAKLAEQYVQFMEAMPVIDVERAGDFLVMAATLMEIKSKMLLPQAPQSEEEPDDPRRELVRQLVEYRKFKDAANLLEDRAEAQSTRFTRESPPDRPGGPPPVRPVELWDLVAAFGRLLREAQALQPKAITVDDTPMHVVQARIRQCLAVKQRVPFADLFDPPHTRGRLVGVFLALLELIKMGEVRVEQAERFGDIIVVAVTPTHQ
jgi:segregation and condensation protein A